MEKWVSAVGIYPYRCSHCAYRFSMFGDDCNGRGSDSRSARTRRVILMYGFGFLLFAVFLYFITRERGGSFDGN